MLKLLRSDKAAGCEFCGQGARRGDLLEIEYTAKLEDGQVFDGSSIKVCAYVKYYAPAYNAGVTFDAMCR